MVIKVAINGYGTIGKRVADAVDAQGDMEIVGVTKTRPAFGCDLAVRKAILFSAHMTQKKKYRLLQMQVIHATGACQTCCLLQT